MPISSIVTKPASVQPGQSRLPLTPTEVLPTEHLGKRSFKVSPRVALTGRITGRAGNSWPWAPPLRRVPAPGAPGGRADPRGGCACAVSNSRSGAILLRGPLARCGGFSRRGRGCVALEESLQRIFFFFKYYPLFIFLSFQGQS